MELIFPSVIVIYIRPTLDFHKTVNVKKWRYWNVRKPEFFFFRLFATSQALASLLSNYFHFCYVV